MCGGSAKSSQTSTYQPQADAMAAYKNVLSKATPLADTAYNPATAKTVADLTPDQMAAFGQISANQGAWQPSVSQAGEMIGSAGQAVNADDISQYMNPWMSDVLDTTLARVRDEDAMTQRDYTAGQVAQSGLGGSGYMIGKADLERNQGANRNATIANLMSEGFNSALAAAQADKTRGLTAGQSMANLGQLTSQLGYADAQALLGAGNQQQAQQQAVNDAATANASQETLWPMQQAQWLASIASGIGPLMGGTTTGNAETSQGKGLGNILGGALTLAGMASDERVKENVVPVGSTHDGQTIYKFNYIGDPTTQIGLIAQEVEQTHPEAVSEIGGVKHVNYDTALGDGRYADGGGVFGDMATVMPWATINPAKPIVPDLPSAPQQEKEGEGQSLEDMFAMGKKAGAGLSSLWGKIAGGGSAAPMASSPAGGAMAASGLQGLGGAGGLMSMFGFADGGLVASPEEMQALEMQESGGRDILGPVTRSGERAEGPRQLMPATQKDPGFGVRPLDQSLTGDARLAEHRRFSDDYFNAMLKRYNGDRDAARIAYNGGPARADAWLRAGRDDSVIPRESANYYKQIAGRLDSGTDGGGTAPTVQKGFAAKSEGGEKYRNSADRASGGLLKRAFGVDFNPLNLTENERRALVVAGLSMMSHGNIGKGGLAGMQYLTGIEAGERDAAAAARKLQYEMSQDAQKQKNWEAEQQLNRDKFGYEKSRDAERLGFDREKLGVESVRPTDDLKEYDAYAAQEIAAGRQPLSQMDYMTAMKRAGKPETNVSVSGEKKGSEEMAKLFAKRYEATQEAGAGAQGILDNLDAVDSALKQGVNTGMLGDWEQSARKLGVALGLRPEDVEKVAAGELVQTISNRMALQVRAPGGDAGGMPGAMSDADRTFLKETVPGLLKTPEGNRQVIAVMRYAANRNLKLAEMATDYAAEHGQLDAGYDREVRKFIKDNPLSAVLKSTAPAAQDVPVPVKTQVIRPRAFNKATGQTLEWDGSAWTPAP